MATTLTEDQIKNVIHSPALIQQLILTDLAKDSEKDISNNSTPFATILETMSVLTSSLANECKNVMRTKFPILADTMEDLYPHLTDTEIINIFSTPSQANFKISIYAMSLIDYGYSDPKDPKYKQVKIPVGTKIAINGTVFTILNPILVKIHTETKTPYAAMLPTTNPLGYSDIGNLNAQIEHDSKNNPYISFTVPIKQVTMTIVSKDSVLEGNLTDSVTLNDKYCYSEIYNTRTLNGVLKNIPVQQVYSTEYLNPSQAQAYITLSDTKVTYKISSIYTNSNLISGTINFIVYETKGEMFLPLDTYKVDNFSITLPDFINNQDKAAKCASNIKILAKGLGVVSGGVNAIDVTKLKEKLINNTTGPIDKPVTQYHINSLAESYGYKIKLLEDLLTHRIYTAYKELPSINVQAIKSIPDIFVNTVKLTLKELESLYPDAVKSNSSVIRSNTVFREDNGQMVLVNPEDLKQIESGSVSARNSYFKNNKHFYNPFTVIIENENGYTSSRCYNLDMPTVNSLRIENKNLNVTNVNVNISGHSIKRLDKGYRVMVQIKGDSAFEDMPLKHKKLYFILHLTDGKIYYQGTYNSDYDLWFVDILFDDFVNADDNLIVANANISGTEFLSPLTTNITIYTCTTDPGSYDDFKSMLEELEEINIDTRDLTMLSKDTLNITFGMRLNYIWNKLFNTYDARKYRRYSEDVYLTYESDVVKRDPYGIKELNISQDKSTLEVIVLHKKGDYVLDENGDKIILHKAGDVILDSNGEPIVDEMADLVRFIDIVMMEYEFKLTDELTYKRMLEIMMSFFNKMLVTELPMINNSLLEKTSILYRPNKSSEPVTLLSDNVKVVVPYIVTPKITIYVDKTLSISVNDKEIYKQKIGDIIVSKLKDKIIKLSDIKSEIMSTLDISISGVKIEGLSPNDSEIIYIDENSNQLTLGKLVTITEYKTNIVTYDLELDFIRLS